VTPKPENFEQIKNKFDQTRRSLSPFSEERFEQFVQLEEGELKQAQPDYYFGSPPEQLKEEVRDEIGEFVIPSTLTRLPILPNYFLEAKGPDGSLTVAARQACFDNVHGARGIQKAIAYAKGEAFDNKAYTISGIYHGGHLRLYTHYPAKPNGTETTPHYWMHQLCSFSMVNTKKVHVQGLAALRNAADLTQEMRDAIIFEANEKATQSIPKEAAGEASSTTPSSTGKTLQSPDEGALQSSTERTSAKRTSISQAQKIEPLNERVSGGKALAVCPTSHFSCN